eukprot:CAMPEP_0170211566 /NCGR_PEP_ID=MMETSP0116_2-20130129/5399_1 /TAXON_ID=400756 /ORGANISM="Durinskia baltica, Strain CSIRO CS-38" /LENGTH=863 /DNA_ID=CAMNT_0010462101 /DNA_START=37 /DNA_END=2629 /DNA_ORIENTATION=-
MAEATEASAEQAVPAEDAVVEDKQAQDEEEKKRSAVEELKAALMKAAASVQRKPPASEEVAVKPEVESLRAFCLCVRQLAKDKAVFKEFEEALPKLGASQLAPLVGVQSAGAAAPDAKASAPQTAQRLFARVKSYNSRKGFGFLEMPGYTRDIFVFNAHLVGRMGLIPGEQVEFILMIEGGRPQARQVRVVSDASGQISANQNPLLAMKQTMATLPPDIALAMALRRLFDKIREAQASSATDKRQQCPDTDAFAREAAEAVRKAQAAKEASSQRWFGHGGGEGDASGSAAQIATGTKVRIVNVPPNQLNNHVGTVRSYDPASGMYSVVVSTQQGGPGENAPLKLKAECLKVEQASGGPMFANAAAAALQVAPAPLPGNVNKSSALQRSANEALKRFSQLSQQQPPPPQQAQPQAAQWLGGMFPGGPCGGPPVPPMGNMAMGKGMGFPGMGAGGMLGFGAAPMAGGFGTPAPVQASAAGPSAMAGKGADSRQRVSLEEGFPKKSAPPPTQRPAQATGTPIEHFARPSMAQAPMQQRPPIGAASMSTGQPPAQQSEGQRAAAQQRPEGRPGQVWRVLASKEFADVIVRETQEVGSRELRRHLPGDTCTQRGMTITLPSGLVRMPVQPDGWVTVHARHIGGPTFLEEIGGATVPPQVARPPQGMAKQSPVPKQAPARREDVPRPFADDPYNKPPEQWSGKSAGKGAKGSADSGGPPPLQRHTMLAVREALQQAGQLRKGDGPRMLHIPQAESSGPREKERREHRRDRDRDRDREKDRGGDRERGERDRGERGERDAPGDQERATPAAPTQTPPMPAFGLAGTVPAPQLGTRSSQEQGQGQDPAPGAGAPPPAAGSSEQNKANCPTQ